ncbi:hypothetical protein [Williamsia sp. CHRR-6]|uniref:hypothetical protein n=1 Tax=Williamsia sp. CHRR-6 TaxID=2835871 RepID=UPI001BDAE329|nr:hypothetical protein [Williamsia sp. CHRR-6]MBT0566598.1 hypothetical protein [Williamsia sp. CHRR-6]
MTVNIDLARHSTTETGSRATHDELIDFGLGWFQRGGGPAEAIRERFGLSEREYFTQLRHRLDGIDTDEVPRRVVEQMKAVCRKRLWLARA